MTCAVGTVGAVTRITRGPITLEVIPFFGSTFHHQSVEGVFHCPKLENGVTKITRSLGVEADLGETKRVIEALSQQTGKWLSHPLKRGLYAGK